jgi:Peptidase A4 family
MRRPRFLAAVLLTVSGLAVLTVSGLSSSAGAARSTETGVESHAPRIPGPGPLQTGAAVVRNWTSSNWSGYAVPGTGFRSATGKWNVPKVGTPNRVGSNYYSSTWVGIDGFNNSSLIQAGTEQDWIKGTPVYQSWWEILPAPETPIPSITVHPGDAMSVSITSGVPDWTITVADTTTGRSFTTQRAYAGPLTSVEWIQEAPTIGTRVAKLAPDSNVVFDLGTANGASPGLVSSEWGAMFHRLKQISTPSLPDRDLSADGFAVAHGSLAPPAPTS